MGECVRESTTFFGCPYSLDWATFDMKISHCSAMSFLFQHRSAEIHCWGHVCMYILRSTRRNNVDRIAKPKPHPLKLIILMFNVKVTLLSCSVLRQIIAGV